MPTTKSFHRLNSVFALGHLYSPIPNILRRALFRGEMCNYYAVGNVKLAAKITTHSQTNNIVSGG